MTAGEIRWPSYQTSNCLVLAPYGDLNAATYRDFRNDLVKFAMDQPRAMIVVADDLRIGSPGSLTAFSSAWMRVGDWPGVPILLVAQHPALRETLTHSTVSRFVPVHADLAAALASLSDPPPRRRAEVELFPITASSRLARAFVRATCQHWNLANRAVDVMEITTELVENSIIHAGTELRLRLELHNGRLAVAVHDGSAQEAVLREHVGPRASGLSLVAHLARVWGCAPDRSGGKVVWAVLPV